MTDDGLSVPAVERERVFDRFVRLDQSRSRSDGGTGLGLPISREIITACGGTVWLTGRYPGTIAVVRLPAAAPAAGPD